MFLLSAVSAPVPTVTLSNGVEMPMLTLGTGTSTWRNNTSTAATVQMGLLAGFSGVDTANSYRNQEGVASGIAEARQAGVKGHVWITTKIEGCGSPESGVIDCFNDTLSKFHQNLELLGTQQVDLTLLHAPPCIPNAPWTEGCGGPGGVYPDHTNCSAAEPCAMVQAQWRALELMYHNNASRAIGVSNYCGACLRCIKQAATVMPHVNQFKLHAAMGSADPAGLVSATMALGSLVHAYQALAHGDGSLLHNEEVAKVGAAHNKSAAQVALRWDLQQGHPIAVSVDKEEFAAEDLDVFDFALTPAEMDLLSSLTSSPDSPVGNMCVL